jgi:nucleoside-diphosphate-sugar epimerase
MLKKIVIFGGAGFVGSHLIKNLVNEGKFAVVSVDRRPHAKRLANVDYRTMDVRELSDLQVEGEIACIYNFAAVHTTPGHPTHEYYDTNVKGAVEITRFAERAGVNEIVFTSSISVYGPSEDTKKEDTPPAPESAYGYSKLLAEGIHRAWLERNSEAKLTIVRPAVVFGPGEGGNFARLAALLKKGFFIYPGRKDTIKACIYVEDLLAAIEFARKRGERFSLFNGAYPGRFTLQQIVETMIVHHFPKARTFMVPRSAVTLGAKGLQTVNFLNLGIHPDRVTKLVRSTDVYPAWLENNGFEFPVNLDPVIAKWSLQTNGTFV